MKKNYVNSEMIKIGRAKVSDGKAVDVTVPEGEEIIAGNFYYLDGFLGAAHETIAKAGGNEVIALNIEQGEYETDQIAKTGQYKKGNPIYFDKGKKEFNDKAGLLAGKITETKDGNNVVTFILAPQAAIIEDTPEA